MKKLLKMFMKKNETGFSLIELMIVVVIIGILSTVAVPQYQNFQKKARQGEAKASLGGLYTTLKTFQAEWNQYYGDFRALGFDQGGTLGYNVGFGAASPAIGPNTHPDITFKSKASVQHSSITRCGALPAKNPECQIAVGKSDMVMSAKAGVAIGVGTFITGATGNIDADVTLDVWTINELKEVTNPLSDVSLN